jgi:flagellar hook-length control protein FliK
MPPGPTGAAAAASAAATAAGTDAANGATAANTGANQAGSATGAASLPSQAAAVQPGAPGNASSNANSANTPHGGNPGTFPGTPAAAPDGLAASQPTAAAAPVFSAASTHATAGAAASAGTQAQAQAPSSAPGLAAPAIQTSPVAPATAAAASTAGHPGVDLGHAIETVRMTLEMAARNGYSQARIQLSPPELGELRIQLHQTPDGLVARVVAQHATAAAALQQGGDDLRRSLQNAGLPLLRLDIEASDQRGPSAEDPNLAGGGHGPRTAQTDDADDAAGGLAASAPTSVELANGAIVDVLA